MSEWVIVWNSARYGGMGDRYPEKVVCTGTREQAENLADEMSNWYAGCTNLFYVLDEESG